MSAGTLSLKDSGFWPAPSSGNVARTSPCLPRCSWARSHDTCPLCHRLRDQSWTTCWSVGCPLTLQAAERLEAFAMIVGTEPGWYVCLTTQCPHIWNALAFSWAIVFNKRLTTHSIPYCILYCTRPEGAKRPRVSYSKCNTLLRANWRLKTSKHDNHNLCKVLPKNNMLACVVH